MTAGQTAASFPFRPAVRLLLCAVCGLLCACHPAPVAESVPAPSVPQSPLAVLPAAETADMHLLAAADTVESKGLGDGGEILSEQSASWARLAASPHAEQAFAELFRRAVCVEGKIYALAGLYPYHRDRYQTLRAQLAAGTVRVQHGDIVLEMALDDVLRELESGALAAHILYWSNAAP